MGATASKFTVWLACVLYICVCCSTVVVQQLITYGSEAETKRTQLVLLNTSSNVQWGAVYTIAIVQAYGYGIYFKPDANAAKKQKPIAKEDMGKIGKQKQEKKKKKKEEEADGAEVVGDTESPKKKDVAWYRSPGWRKWWTFCRSLGHKDMTIPTLFGAGSVIGYGTLVMSENLPNALSNKAMAIELSIAMIEAGWLCVALHSGWFLYEGYATAIKALDLAAKEARDKAKKDGKDMGKEVKKIADTAVDKEEEAGGEPKKTK